MELSTLIRVVCVLLGLIGFTYGVLLIIRELLIFIRVKKSGYLVQGIIIDFKEIRRDEGVGYPAVVTYKTVEGKVITATAETSTGIKPVIGKEVWLVYDPKDPTHFYYRRSILPFLYVVLILAFGFASIFSILELYNMFLR